jgi:hypothetical protein
VGLLAVAVTGAWRTRNELSSWHDLASTAYGRTVAVKLALAAAIAALGAFNRWRSVPSAATSLRLLRRAGGGELALAAGAVVAAAVLGTLAPPRSGYAAPTELEAEGADFGTTVRVRLNAASDQPGPNRFLARVVDYDSKDPVPARRVTLRFTPLDDPGVASTSLALDRGAGEAWEGSGPNLAFDGRWRITTRIERERDSVEGPARRRGEDHPAVRLRGAHPGAGPEIYGGGAHRGIRALLSGLRASRPQRGLGHVLRRRGRRAADRADGGDPSPAPTATSAPLRSGGCGPEASSSMSC